MGNINDTMNEAFNKVGNMIADEITGVINDSVNVLTTEIKNIAGDISAPIVGFYDTAMSVINDDIVSPLQTVGSFVSEIPNLISSMGNTVISSLEDGVNKIGNSVMGELNQLTNVIMQVPGLFSSIIGTVQNAFESFGNDIINTFTALGYQIVAVFEPIIDDAMKFGIWVADFFIYLGGYFICFGYFIQIFFTTPCVFHYILSLIILTIWAIIEAILYCAGFQCYSQTIVDTFYSLNDSIRCTTKEYYKPDGIDIIKTIYPDHCYNCPGFDPNGFPEFPF